MKSENNYYNYFTLNFIFVNVCVIVLAFLAVDASHDKCDPEENGLTPPFNFSYREYQELTLKVNFINISPNMTYKLYETILFKRDRKSNLIKKGPNMVKEIDYKEDKECFSKKWKHEVKNHLSSILLEMSSSNASWCQNVTIFEGRLLYTDVYVDQKEYKYNYECSTSDGCTILVNLTRDCTETRNVTTTEESSSETDDDDDDDDDVVLTSPISINIDTATINSTASYENTSETSEGPAHHESPPKSNVAAYVIPAVIVICVIILIIYIWVKKYYRRHSPPVETLEMDTYATASDVVYADLNLVQGQPPRIDEASPYARIIGVMKPVDK